MTNRQKPAANYLEENSIPLSGNPKLIIHFLLERLHRHEGGRGKKGGKLPSKGFQGRKFGRAGEMRFTLPWALFFRALNGPLSYLS